MTNQIIVNEQRFPDLVKLRAVINSQEPKEQVFRAAVCYTLLALGLQRDKEVKE